MPLLPDLLIEAWKKKEGPAVFSTVDKNGMPNSIYASSVSLYKKEYILIADNYFSKTKRNILNGSPASILFLTSEKKSFQLKGSIEYYMDGEFFEDMKKWNSSKHPGHAVAVLKIQRAYSGSEEIL